MLLIRSRLRACVLLEAVCLPLVSEHVAQHAVDHSCLELLRAGYNVVVDVRARDALEILFLRSLLVNGQATSRDTRESHVAGVKSLYLKNRIAFLVKPLGRN